MNKISALISKLFTVGSMCLAIVLTISANTNSCIFMNEPEAPEGLSKFKFRKKQ